MPSTIEILRAHEKKIVDLSRRNRLLKYPKTARAINFDMSFTEFQEKFGSIEELHIEFPHKAILNAEDNDKSLFNGEEAKDNEVYLPPTKPSGEKLITLFNTLRLDTKRKFEEHGLHTLFLTIGKVRWKEPLAGRGSTNATAEFDYNAPLLLVPISIKETKRPKATVIETFLEENDITANRVLSLLLEKEFRTPAITLKEERLSNLDALMSDLLLQTKQILDELNITYEISKEIQIGQYSFYGQQIYEDLTRNEQSIVNHEFINALCSHTPIRQENLNIALDNPDALLTAENDFSVLDADVSQLLVIQKVLKQNHLNVQGPPGTGKSQTIVNLISNLLARRKTVLVVCEKTVALEVVLDRLRQTGLDKLCLPLFHYNTDKKEFAKSIIRDRDYVAQYYATEQQSLDRILTLRQQRIEKLRNYACALGEVVNPLGKTVQWVHGELARVQGINPDVSMPWRGPDPLSVSFDDYRTLVSILDNLGPIFNLPSQEKFSHWKAVKRAHFSPDFISRVNQTLLKIQGLLEEYLQLKSHPLFPTSVSQIRYYISLAPALLSIQPIKEPLDLDKDIAGVSHILDDAQERFEGYFRIANSSQKKFRVPLNWNHSLFSTFNNRIKPSTSIAALQDAKTKADLITNALQEVKSNLAKAPNKNVIIESPIDELLTAKRVFLIDPVIKYLRSWNKVATLQPAVEQLKNLNTILLRLDEARQIFSKWTIIPEELDYNAISSLVQRFEGRYKYFFRFLYPSYRTDCRTVNEWCSATAPKKYVEYAKLALAVKDWFKLRSRLKHLVDEFSKNYLKRDVTIEPQVLPILYTNASQVLEWLYSESKEEIPQAYVTFIDQYDDYQSLKKIFNALGSLNQAVTTSWNIFEFSELQKSLSLKGLSEAYPSLKAHIEHCSTLYQAVTSLLSSDSCPTNVAELLNDANTVDKLALSLEEIRSLKLEDVFITDPIIPRIMQSYEPFKALVNNVKNTALTIGQLPQLKQKKVSVKKALEIIGLLGQNLPIWQRFTDAYNKQVEELNRLFESNSSIHRIEPLTFIEFINRLGIMIKDQRGLEYWTLYRKYTAQLLNLGYAWFLEESEGLNLSHPSALFAVSLWNAWLDQVYTTHPALQSFNQKEHQKLISDFQELEDQVLKVNASRVLKTAAPGIKYAKDFGGREDKELVHQSGLTRRHKPIRKLVQLSGQQLQRYKPCWMMSPLTLSSYIPYGRLNFDVVIFDEASQMRVEHSLGAIGRAKQVIVFGDENQLPPTSFFDVSSDSEEDDELDEDYESILHAANIVLPGAHELLSYHYRSKYEDLIAFSNHYVYRDNLITFPNANHYQAVQFDYVENGIFDSGGTRRNDIEARRVIELCAAQAVAEPKKSIGVIAFSKAQEQAIRDATKTFLSNNRNPLLQTKLDENSDELDHFFIKNLESVQGDERDVIMLSVGYGKDKHGNMYNRFGPINGKYGYRRLNVAVTRAKEKVICVSSIKATDVRPKEGNRGAQLLQKYLEYAEHGIKVLNASRLVQANRDIEPDSPFELEVENALMRLGYTVHRQVGVSGFKIDLAILNPANDQEYILGVECDGATYHSSYSARVNDRIRQEILERLGWRIYRVWWLCCVNRNGSSLPQR
jgi:superfamily I DNA and/or RNA helicase/very-short-patch-repair endonuclease